MPKGTARRPSFQPMLASREAPDTSSMSYPIYASPKLDGVRALVRGGRLVSRALKPIPNSFVSSRFSLREYNGLDGELILGSPTAPDVYRVTQKALSAHGGEPDVTFYCFDVWDEPKLPYHERQQILVARCKDLPHVFCLTGRHIPHEPELLLYEESTLNQGYEGLILRSPGGLYKHGRATLREATMMKLKRFTDSEAEVLGIAEEMHNGNEATTDKLGRTERSSHQAGLTGKARMGKLACLDRKYFPDAPFGCGTGFTAKEREEIWRRRTGERVQLATGVDGKLEWYWKVERPWTVKYKYFAHGVKDRPRHPVYLGERGKWDQ